MAKLANLFLPILIFQSLLLHDLTLAKFEFTEEWNGGWAGILFIDIDRDINGWGVILEFDRPLTELEPFKALLVSAEDGNQIYHLENQPWNDILPNGTVLDFDFLIRYPENTIAPQLIAAWINHRPVDVSPGDGTTTGTTTTTTTPPTNGTSTTTTTRQPPIGYDYGEVIGLSLLFYEAQRTGPLPPTNRIPWRGDSFVDDGADVGLDLSGGYFDAGDHVKFGFPFASFTTIMGWGVLDYKDGYVAAGEYENALAALRWSLDYFIKAHPSPNEFYGQSGNGHEDHSFWGRPEEWPVDRVRPSYKITTSAPGSDLAAETAASFAVGYLIFKDSDPLFAAECLRHAEQLYEFANQYRGVYSDSITNARDFYNSWSGYGDELGWGAAWMYRATEDEKYLVDFRSHWNEFGLGGRPAEFSWDDKKAGLQVLMAKLTGEPIYVEAARTFCNYIVNEVPRSPLGLTWLSQWGSLRHTSNVAFVCLQAADAGINPSIYREFVTQQIGYILGDTGRSYVVGYGVNPPQRPHHRASSCPDRPAVCNNDALINPNPNPQILYGALVGGPDINDFYEDDRNDYIKNEVATDYNAGFQSVLAGLNSLRVRANRAV